MEWFLEITKGWKIKRMCTSISKDLHGLMVGTVNFVFQEKDQVDGREWEANSKGV